MDKIQSILSIIGIIIGLLATSLTFLLKWVKNVKARKILSEGVNICNSILPLISEAETFAHYSGAEKKAFVMTKAMQYAAVNGLNFNEEDISRWVDELVKLSKEVNYKEDKPNGSGENRNNAGYAQ